MKEENKTPGRKDFESALLQELQRRAEFDIDFANAYLMINPETFEYMIVPGETIFSDEYEGFEAFPCMNFAEETDRYSDSFHISESKLRRLADYLFA